MFTVTHKLTRTLATVLLLAATAGANTLFSATPAKAQSPIPLSGLFQFGVKDRIVLRIAPGQPANVITQINSQYGTRTQQMLPAISGAYIVARTNWLRTSQSIVDAMATDTRIEFAEIDAETSQLGALPFRMGAWGQPAAQQARAQVAAVKLGLNQAHRLSTGKGITVAVIDTGAQLDHPDLVDVLVPGYDFIDNDSVPEDVADGKDNNSDGRVDEVHGHGTHVAGIVHLVAPEAKIMPIRVLDADGGGSQVNLSLAIIYAVERGATIVNVSMGTNRNSAFLHGVVREYRNKGILIVAAAGNQGASLMQFPAADGCAFGVMSLADTDAPSSFTNYGNWVDFAAPGEAIYSTFPRSRYAYWSGTSMATPFISGLLALVRSAAPRLPIATLVDIVGKNSAKLAGGSTTQLVVTSSTKPGVGLINAGGSIQSAMTATNTVTAPATQSTARPRPRGRLFEGLFGGLLGGILNPIAPIQTIASPDFCG